MKRKMKIVNPVLAALVLASFALSPAAQAVSPAPDGGYSGKNTAEGTDALSSLTAGLDNTANGFEALFHNTTGSANTAIGVEALFSNTTGFDNIAVGNGALLNNTGNSNTAIGFNALQDNTTASGNTADGFEALFHNTTGGANTANGFEALLSNTTGHDNTANGFEALFSNTIGHDNTATGLRALEMNTTGNFNTAIGTGALLNNTASNNTATGYDALNSNTTGSQNTANGWEALFSNTTGGANTATGLNALIRNTTGSGNIALGVSAGGGLTTGSNNIDIGNGGAPGESNTIRIGTVGTQTATFIAGIHGVSVTGSAVVVSTVGQLGVAPSSARFKQVIKPMGNASEAILALKPVTFFYNKELDPEGTPQFGLVAEQVEKVNPDLITRDRDGKPYTVRYEAVNAMLLNEFLKEHHKVEQQRKDFEAALAHQQEQIEALTAGLQKVSAQVELSKPAPQTVAGNTQ